MNKEIENILFELAEIFLHGEVSSKYKKEKIPKLDTKIKDTKTIFEKFKLIEKRNSWKMSREEIFYRQAKLMEDYSLEEEIKAKEKFEDLNFQNCTYAGFSFEDFKEYFSWRTKIRKNIYEEINWKYDEIYINELLNLIGVKDEEEAIQKLIEFWNGCRNYQKNLDKKMPERKLRNSNKWIQGIEAAVGFLWVVFPIASKERMNIFQGMSIGESIAIGLEIIIGFIIVVGVAIIQSKTRKEEWEEENNDKRSD